MSRKAESLSGPSLDELVQRAVLLVDRVAPGRRALLGIAGPPGAGKSTLAQVLADRLGPHRAALVPMDGFHIADAVLAADGRRERKGAPDTFDADGYLAVLQRLGDAGRTVYTPRFDRGIEDSIAAAIEVPAGIPLVVTEGNYLLHWPPVRASLDECWYIDPPPEARRARLIARHRAFGKSPEQARVSALGSDERNAEVIAAGRGSADLVIAGDVDLDD